jgi:hypothetical protein
MYSYMYVDSVWVGYWEVLISLQYMSNKHFNRFCSKLLSCPPSGKTLSGSGTIDVRLAVSIGIFFFLTVSPHFLLFLQWVGGGRGYSNGVACSSEATA